MNNTSTLTANFSNYKFLSILFLFVFIGLGQTAFSQTHVVILKGNRLPPSVSRTICVDPGGFNIDVLNIHGNGINDVTVSITMVDDATGASITSDYSLGSMGYGETMNVAFNIPASFSSHRGVLTIGIEHELNSNYTFVSETIPYNSECGN